jgi:hypothetical protein
MELDNTGELLCNLLIDADSRVDQHDKDCEFSGLDQLTHDTNLRFFKAKFSSAQAAEEFKTNFLEVRSDPDHMLLV